MYDFSKSKLPSDRSQSFDLQIEMKNLMRRAHETQLKTMFDIYSISRPKKNRMTVGDAIIVITMGTLLVSIPSCILSKDAAADQPSLQYSMDRFPR